MKISFITTIYNEEETIESFLASLLAQARLPDEIIIVDGGSRDNTLSVISTIKFPITYVKIIQKKGNRSVGRNEAIKHAKGDIIICSDSGNILDKGWITHIIQPFTDKKVDVVAGYYKGNARNVFQKCVIPYALVMPDKVDSKSFLPATRSIAFTKKIWEKVGKFDESLSHNEDYAFAHALKRVNAKIVFKKEAIVYWMPGNTVKEAYTMFLRFAYGDAEAKIVRPKVLFIFIRYFIGIALLLWAIMAKSLLLSSIVVIGLILYTLWAIQKNYKYVKEWQGLYLLPLMQHISDIAVIIGTTQGLFKVWDTKKTS